MVLQHFTLVFVKRNNKVLMGHKTRGFGVGLWNGFGGKLEKGESVHNAALRELKEECNLFGDLNYIGIVHYLIEKEQIEHIVHIFTTFNYSGEIIESEEMSPIRWFKTTEIPFQKMWPDCPNWYPYMLNNNYFYAKITYNDLCDDFIKSADIKQFNSFNEFANATNDISKVE